MALTKRTYVDGETIITAQNLNDIQDEIISHGNTLVPKTRTVAGKALSSNITLNASDIVNNSDVDGSKVDDALEILSGEIDTLKAYLTLESVAINSKTYADMFFGDYNILSMLYPDGWTYLPLVANTTTKPQIEEVTNPVSLGHNALKCFGTSSVQLCFESATVSPTFTQNHKYYVAMVIKVPRYSQGTCGMSFGDSALSALSNNAVCDWTLVSAISTYSSATGKHNIYVGTANSANADCYIACPVIVDLTAMGLSSPTKADIDKLYLNYITLTDSSDFRARKMMYRYPKLAATVMDATDDGNRFYGVKQLYGIAQKKLINPFYSVKSIEHYLVVKGIVCEVPDHNGAYYENYTFKTLFSINATTATRPASTIKTLNAATALYYNLDLNEQYTIESGDVLSGSGSAYAAGDILTVKDLLYAMFLESSNTCANALGTMTGRKILHNPSATNTNARNAFVSAMSARLQEIGGSAWSGNASGYNSTATLTATDLLRILIEASSFPEILRIWNKKSYTVKVGGSDARNIDITTTVGNTSLENDYYIFGGKTGSTGDYRALVLISEPK